MRLLRGYITLEQYREQLHDHYPHEGFTVQTSHSDNDVPQDVRTLRSGGGLEQRGRPSGNMMWGDTGVPVCGEVCECVEGGVLPCAGAITSVTTWSLHIVA